MILTTLLTFWRAVQSKVGLYLIGAGVITIILWRIVAGIKASATTTEKLKQSEATLRQNQKEYKQRADIDALAAADARDRLLKRWSRR